MPCQDCRELLQVECHDGVEIHELVARSDGSQVFAADTVVKVLQGEHQFDGCYTNGTVFRTLAVVSKMPVWRSGDELMTLAQSKVRDLTRRHPLLQDEPQLLSSITSHFEMLIRKQFGSSDAERNFVLFDRASFNRLDIACDQFAYEKIGEIRPDMTPMFYSELLVALSRSWQSNKSLVNPPEGRLARRIFDIYGPSLRDERAKAALKLDCEIVTSSNQFGCAYYEQVQWHSGSDEYAIPVGMSLPKSEFSNPTVRKDQLISRMKSGFNTLINHQNSQISNDTWQDIKSIVRARSATLVQINEIKKYLYNITDITEFREIGFIFGIIPVEVVIEDAINSVQVSSNESI